MSEGYSVLFLPLCPHREGHQEWAPLRAGKAGGGGNRNETTLSADPGLQTQPGNAHIPYPPLCLKRMKIIQIEVESARYPWGETLTRI